MGRLILSRPSLAPFLPLHVKPTCLPPFGHCRTVPPGSPCRGACEPTATAPKTYPSTPPRLRPLPDLAWPRAGGPPDPPAPSNLPAAPPPDPGLPRQNPAAPHPRPGESGGLGLSSHGGRGGEHLAVPDLHPHHDRAAARALHHHAPVPRRLREGQDHPLPLLGVPPLREVPQVDLQEGADAAARLLPFIFCRLVLLLVGSVWECCSICFSDSVLLVLTSQISNFSTCSNLTIVLLWIFMIFLVYYIKHVSREVCIFLLHQLSITF